jgi:Zn-dependent oligopeptidase
VCDHYCCNSNHQIHSFDQTIHKQQKVDTAKVFADVQSSVLSCFPLTEGTNPCSAFGHLAGGYSASYYGYLWSEVIAEDMFVERFKKEGVLNPKTGASYRSEILAVAGARDGMDSATAFIGRAPTQRNFLLSKGCTVSDDEE